MAVLILALAIAQTVAMPSGYTDDEGRTEKHAQHKVGKTTTPSPTGGSTSTLDGTALYSQYCAGCHGTSKKGSSAAAIQSAINSVSQMKSLKSLTAAQISAIAGGAAAPAPAGGTTATSDGTALYNQYCSGCHSKSKLGTSAATIQKAINSNTGGMGALKSLTPAQILAISKGGSTTAPGSSSLPTFTPTPVKTFTPTPVPTLSTAPAPTPAAKTWAQYNQYCAGCHGASMQGSSAATIQSAINNVMQMGALKSLTPAQISAIAAGQ
jgi:mono/diheme cytochrome c family protein